MFDIVDWCFNNKFKAGLAIGIMTTAVVTFII